MRCPYCGIPLHALARAEHIRRWHGLEALASQQCWWSQVFRRGGKGLALVAILVLVCYLASRCGVSP